MSRPAAPGMAVQAGAGAARYTLDRVGGHKWLKKQMNKVFPDHWSFLLGEVALYSFIILLLTGIYLTLFFDSSPVEVVYNGNYAPLHGVRMSAAYASTLHISFDVRGGLLMRQIHHWAALVFISSIMVHLLRVFFTGAFRRPRELNWLIGFTMMILAILEGFLGYSLPDDLLSGTGIRVGYSILESIPLVGSWAAWLLWGGDFPGTAFLGRIYSIHILLFPLILLGAVSAHLAIIWRQKHTQFPGKGRTEHNVVGARFYPVAAAKAGALFFVVFGVIVIMSGLFQINPVWLWGPYNPTQVSAGTQPDWYLGWMDGLLRLMPGTETRFLGQTIPWNVLVPAVILPGAFFTPIAVWPFVEQKLTGEGKREPHLLDRPRNRPVRVGAGVAGIIFFAIALFAGGNDIIAKTFNISLFATTWTFRVLIILGPIAGFWAARRWCIALQRADHDLVHHGVETGRVLRLPHGEVVEVHAPLPELQHAYIEPAPDEVAALTDGTANGSGPAPRRRPRRGLVDRLRDRGDAPAADETPPPPVTLTRQR
ncbi:MAG: ubiquinol-cytochrome c reductase cytochrome b subunit [Frankiaceae bacterium]|nr:ubiquinol-cytochrome c reductase cytochrome b subunit [Frankiaceae bacterium]